jgi:hypothetical protein
MGVSAGSTLLIFVLLAASPDLPSILIKPEPLFHIGSLRPAATQDDQQYRRGPRPCRS